MSIDELYDGETIIRNLETALQIDGADFEERNLDTMISNVKKRISRQYQVDFTTSKISDAEFDLGVQMNTAQTFMSNITRLHARVCGWCQSMRYQATTTLSLSKINNLGYTVESLNSILLALQSKRTQPRAAEAIDSLKQKMPSIMVCKEKRLFVLMIIAYELGFNELTAAIAEVLYLCRVIGF